MKTLVCIGLLALAALPLVFGADTEKVTYYVQLIRGNNDDKPPVPQAKRIGPKLSKKLCPVFKWESYWEISRQQIELGRGQKAKVKLSREREVVIDLSDAAKRKVIVYSEGKEVSRISRPVGEGMTVVGGDRGHDSVWFIVVRRDKPSEPEDASK